MIGLLTLYLYLGGCLLIGAMMVDKIDGVALAMVVVLWPVMLPFIIISAKVNKFNKGKKKKGIANDR